MSAFIVLEGIEGSGKSTVAAALAKHAKRTVNEVILTREPGATPIGAELRKIILNPENTELSSLTELLLFAADRAQHLEQLIKPALARGAVVISDRFMYSTLAYQGYGRGLSLDILQQLNAIIVANFQPDIVLLLDVDPQQALQRVQARTNNTIGARLDRIELQGLDFHCRVHQGFHQIAKQEKNFVILNASKPLDEVIKQAIEACEALF